MKVKDIMSAPVRVCEPHTSLAEAAALMLDADCGMLPVVDDHGRLTGLVTDRDMYIALATRDTLASQLTVGDVARSDVFRCGPDEDVHMALDAMKQHRVRRLPVEGFNGIVVGIISMNDIVLAAGARKPVRSDEVVEALQAICAHTHPTPHVTAA